MKSEPEPKQSALALVSELLLGLLGGEEAEPYLIESGALHLVVKALADKVLVAAEQGREAELLAGWQAGLKPLRRRLLNCGTPAELEGVTCPLITRKDVVRTLFSPALTLSLSGIQLEDGEVQTWRFSTLDRVCHRISVVSTSNDDTVVQVSWRDNDNGNHQEPDLKSGRQTRCFGKVAILSVIAVGGDAVIQRMVCDCPS